MTIEEAARRLKEGDYVGGTCGVSHYDLIQWLIELRRCREVLAPFDPQLFSPKGRHKISSIRGTISYLIERLKHHPLCHSEADELRFLLRTDDGFCPLYWSGYGAHYASLAVRSKPLGGEILFTSARRLIHKGSAGTIPELS